jgi:23S rRNA (guanine745-N1)-methyltransferase
MPQLICPVCGLPLTLEAKTYRCEKNHCFDCAKSGYVNLLPPAPGGKRHGDDKLMVAARRLFLNKGYYEPLRDTVQQLAGQGHTILDVGCGEGYYTSALAENNEVCGVDISKDALKLAAKRCPNSEFAVASIGNIPLSDGAADTIVNIFAPDSPTEYLRVLKSGGRLITALPMERHLFELKAAVYDEPYLNPAVVTRREGFTLTTSKELKYSITLSSTEDIDALFKMTPYYYKTSARDQAKLNDLDSLTVGLEFMICEYTKNG